jgi:hypothetical protein
MLLRSKSQPVEGLEPPLFVYHFTKVVLSPLSHTGMKVFIKERWAEKDSNLRRHMSFDLQSNLFGHFSIYPLKFGTIGRIRTDTGAILSRLSLPLDYYGNIKKVRPEGFEPPTKSL